MSVKKARLLSCKKAELCTGVACHSFPSPGDLPDPVIELWSPALPADSLPSELPGEPTFSRGNLHSESNWQS